MHNTHQPRKDQTIAFTKELLVLIFIVIPLAFGILSLILGKDINWDLKNYHYYNAYAFIEGRLGFDIAPAQLQSFFNPLLDIPFYILVKNFPAWVAGFTLGVIHGLNLSLIFLIFWKISLSSNNWKKVFMGGCLVVISSMAPGFLSELGNTMNDNLTSLFILFAIFIQILVLEKTNNAQHKSSFILMGISGMVMGICIGLKPTNSIFAIGSTLAFITTMYVSLKNKFLNLIIYSILGVIGCLISAGFWCWELWLRYGNPLLPFYNHIFKSPYIAPKPFIFDKFVPEQLWEYIIWPFLFSQNSYRVNQLKFSDIRFAVLYFISIVWIIMLLFKKFSTTKQDMVNKKHWFDLNSGNYLLVFTLVSFIFWMVQSSVYRFIIVLELLVPLCFLIIIERLNLSNKFQITIIITATILTIASFRPFNWGRVEWGNSYFSIDTSQFDTSENAIVIMLGLAPTAYIIPEFPENFRFLRPQSNLINNEDLFEFSIIIKDLISEHDGTFYILFNKDDKRVQLKNSLAANGLELLSENCHQLKVNNPDRLMLCQAFKLKQENQSTFSR